MPLNGKAGLKNITADPYSLNVSPSNFQLFPNVKMAMKENHFDSMQDMEVPQRCH